ncbi:hypothetical protein PYCC9005_000381 [Savitreella phatthalungensis]
MSVAAQDTTRSSTPSRGPENKAPLLQGAGSVTTLSPASAASDTGKVQGGSLSHDLNSAHTHKPDISREASPGMGSSRDSPAGGPPNWMDQDSILDAASSGQAKDGETTRVTGEEIARTQNVKDNDAKMKGPTGNAYGDHDLGASDPSFGDMHEHDRQQKQRLSGIPSKDGEGSAGLPYDNDGLAQ